VLIYLHGFNSSPQSKKARELRSDMAKHGLEAQFTCPVLPNEPARAIEAVKVELERVASGPAVLVGSSLGGFYATWFAETYGLRAFQVTSVEFWPSRA